MKSLCSSNPLSTQDDVAAALTSQGDTVHAAAGVDIATYYRHIDAALDIEPHFVLDDGCDLVSRLHTERRELLSGVVAGCEETTTGVVRLRAMVGAGALRFPVVAVNDTATKRLVDNRYGTGQSTLDAFTAYDEHAACRQGVVVVAGYGWCGKGSRSAPPAWAQLWRSPRSTRRGHSMRFCRVIAFFRWPRLRSSVTSS